jgi:geranylgeranyl diphosphate synthase, type I
MQPPADLGSAASERFRALVDQELKVFLEGQVERMSGFAPDAVLLVEELHRVLRSGGKRVRPLFCYWGYVAGGGEPGPAIVRAGAAVEMLHTAAIVHDDVMDRSTLRRGQPPTFRRLAAGGDGATSDEAFGVAAAILAGDLAQAFADELLATSGFPPGSLLAAMQVFDRMRVEAVAGEYLDLLQSLRGNRDEAEARRVGGLKSGSYTILGPVLMGATLAGAEPTVLEGLERYGRPLGEAFQLRDDALSSFGDPLVTGKDPDADIRERRQTALLVRARRLAPGDRRLALAELSGGVPLSPSQVEEVRAAIEGSGALSEGVRLIEQLVEEAVDALRDLAIFADAKGALTDLAGLVALRQA